MNKKATKYCKIKNTYQWQNALQATSQLKCKGICLDITMRLLCIIPAASRLYTDGGTTAQPRPCLSSSPDLIHVSLPTLALALSLLITHPLLLSSFSLSSHSLLNTITCTSQLAGADVHRGETEG